MVLSRDAPCMCCHGANQGDDNGQHIARKLGQALLISPPHAQNAIEFFAAVRSPEMRSIASTTIEWLQCDGEAGLRPLAKKIARGY